MRRAFFCCGLFIAALTVHAAPPTVSSIEALLDALDEKSQLTEVYSSLDVINRQGATLRYGQGRPQLNAEQQRAVDIVVATAGNVYRRDLNWEGIKPDVIKSMQEAFTQEQVDAAVAFYTSPLGKAFLQGLPLVKQKTALLIRSRLEQIQPRAIQEVEKALRDAKLVK